MDPSTRATKGPDLPRSEGSQDTRLPMLKSTNSQPNEDHQAIQRKSFITSISHGYFTFSIHLMSHNHSLLLPKLLKLVRELGFLLHKENTVFRLTAPWSFYFQTHNLPTSISIPLEKAMAPHSSTVAWKIPWTEEPGRLHSMVSRRVGHDWATSLSLFTFMHWRRKWQPTPVFLFGESQGQGSLVGCHLWGRTKSDTTEVT